MKVKTKLRNVKKKLACGSCPKLLGILWCYDWCLITIERVEPNFMKNQPYQPVTGLFRHERTYLERNKPISL